MQNGLDKHACFWACNDSCNVFIDRVAQPNWWQYIVSYYHINPPQTQNWSVSMPSACKNSGEAPMLMFSLVILSLSLALSTALSLCSLYAAWGHLVTPVHSVLCGEKRSFFRPQWKGQIKQWSQPSLLLSGASMLREEQHCHCHACWLWLHFRHSDKWLPLYTDSAVFWCPSKMSLWRYSLFVFP